MAAFMRRFAQFLGAEDGVVAEADHAVTASDADRVGGFSPDGLVRVGGCAADDAPDGTDYWCEFALDAPVDGWAALTGAADLKTTAVGDLLFCRFSVDGTPVPSSIHGVKLLSGDGSNENDCVSTGVVPLVAGNHTIRFEVYNVSPSTVLYGVAAHGVYSAHNGTGN
jgi:hypothetical protein